MNEVDIKRFVSELDWSLPRTVQKQAIDAHSATDKKYYPLILDKTRKSTWENSVAVIERIGYRKTKLYFVSLFGCCRMSIGRVPRRQYGIFLL